MKTTRNTEDFLNDIHGAIASGRYCLSEPDVDKEQVRVGRELSLLIDGERIKCVALLPYIVREIIGVPNHVERRFLEILVRSKNGLPLRGVIFDHPREPAQCMVIRADDFWLRDDDSDDDCEA